MKNNKKGNIPIGFSMSLAQNPAALNNYSNLSDEEREKINTQIKSSTTGHEAKNKIENIISDLENNNINNMF